MTAVDPPENAASHRGTHSAACAQGRAEGESATVVTLLAQLAGKPGNEWLDSGRTLALEHDLMGASAVLQAAVAQHGEDSELQMALASVRWQLQDHAGAQALLEALLARFPDHVAAALTLARLHVERSRVLMAESVLCNLFGQYRQPPELAYRAARMLADAGRKQGAADLCEAAIAVGTDAPLLRVYVAALQGQLGDFERSRSHYVFALEHDAQVLGAGAAYGLATIKHYADPGDPDLARFKSLLARGDLAPDARASVLFALGKAYDDLADYAQAAACLREANALVDHRSWSRKNWRRMVEARLGSALVPPRKPAVTECVPIFVVGAPRSGTTLVAELLGRSREVCNRGELDWLPHFAAQVARAGNVDRALLDQVAAAYLIHLQQGAVGPRWFVDKQPLNFLHVGLIRALFPQARIVYCRRSQRDTALSIWSQHFDSAEYRFAYDFADIAAVLSGCERLMLKAGRGGDLLEVRYEDLVREPQAVCSALATRLGLASFCIDSPRSARHAIGTASVWQARQPVYTRAVGRWHGYAPFVPELLRFADD